MGASSSWATGVLRLMSLIQLTDRLDVGVLDEDFLSDRELLRISPSLVGEGAGCEHHHGVLQSDAGAVDGAYSARIDVDEAKYDDLFIQESGVNVTLFGNNFFDFHGDHLLNRANSLHFHSLF